MNGHRDTTPRFKNIPVKKPKKFLSKKRTVTGEGKLFSEIIAERSIGGKTYSQVSGELIESPNEFNCHHLLPKGSYPAFRLNKDNIIIISEDEHFDFHNNTAKIKGDPKWKWVWDKIQELKELYNQKAVA